MTVYTPQPYKKDADETVQCPQCQCFNSPDAKFCDQCGYELMGSADVSVERRSVALVNPSVDGLNVSGYAAVFDSPWSNVLIDKLGYVETIQRGAFRKVLGNGQNVPLLNEHRDILASTHGGTLKLAEDAKGLAVQATLPDSPRGHDIAALIANGTVRGMSFGMETRSSDSSVDRKSKPPTRQIRSMQNLLDVSLTWNPAYPASTAELRAEQFAAVTLQDLVKGEESQHDQVAAGHGASGTGATGTGITSAAIAARMRAMEINELLLGGNSQCAETKSPR